MFVMPQSAYPNDNSRYYISRPAENWRTFQQQGLRRAVQKGLQRELDGIENNFRLMTGQPLQGTQSSAATFVRDLRHYGPKQAAVRQVTGRISALSNDVNALVGNPFESVSFVVPSAPSKQAT